MEVTKRVANLAGVDVGGASPVRLVAVINVSPESFYEGSIKGDGSALRDAARRCVDEGADMIDIGAMSTAPYLQTHISTAEERRRLVSAIEIVRDSVALPISADTARAEVAAAALSAGATVINDVTGLLGDMGMAEVAADAQGVILMASRDDGAGGAPVARVRRCLERSLEVAARAGIAEDRIVLDPGIGFFTRSGMSGTEFNCAVLRDLAELDGLGLPLLVGVSRKSFLGELTGGREASERLAGSLAATAIAVNNGASAIRTHDVGATLDAIRVASALRQRAKR